jgi:hypothetical protein
MIKVMLSLSFASKNQMMLLKPNKIFAIIKLTTKVHNFKEFQNHQLLILITLSLIINKIITIPKIPKTTFLRLNNEVEATLIKANHTKQETHF